MRETQHILISQAASIRAKQKEDKHKQQGIAMRQSFVEKENLLRNPVNMIDALKEVRTSDITIPDELSRYQGTTLYNKPPPIKR